MSAASINGFLKCLSVKLAGFHSSTPDPSVRFEVAGIDIVIGRDLVMKWSHFVQVRIKQGASNTTEKGVYVFAVLLECGPILYFMPIGVHQDLFGSWEDVQDWQTVFKRNLVS
jgi:hypothetical protein